jgi:hypothetical protein
MNKKIKVEPGGIRCQVFFPERAIGILAWVRRQRVPENR